MSDDLTRSTATLCGLLASETRLTLLLALAKGPKSVSALAEIAGLTLSATSQQLQKLLARDIVTFTREVRTVTYRLVEPVDPTLAHVLERLRG